MGNTTTSCGTSSLDSIPLPPGSPPRPINMSCSNLGDPSLYGLTTYDFTIATQRDSTGQFIFNVVIPFITGAVTVTAIAAPYQGSSVVQLLSVTSSNTNVIPTIEFVSVINISFNTGNYNIVYSVPFEFLVRGPEAGTPALSNGVTITVNRLGRLPPDAIPNIMETIHMTPDGKQVCQVDYTTIVMKECCKVTSSYIQYCPDIASVLCGPGCTIESKVGKDRVPSVVTYAVLRMVLSSEIMDMCFTPESLRQRYYKEFLKRLRNGVWSAFFEVLQDSIAVDYWQLFKK